MNQGLCNSPHVMALHTGTPAEYADDGRVWRSSIGRTTRTESVWIGPEGFEGDTPADLKNHGGPERAACVYPLAHLTHWAKALDRPDIRPGAFGENLTVADVDETQVAIGDVWVVGSATVEVSQPRSPCWKLARRLGVSDFVRVVRDSGRTGWYLRVREPGAIGPGETAEIVHRPFPHLTVSVVNHARWSGAGRELNAELASCHLLSEGWRAHFARRIPNRDSQ